MDGNRQDGQGELSKSPKEDYNPLEDDLQTILNNMHDTDEEDGEASESPYSSLDADSVNVFRYAVTPPNPRELRRHKEKAKSPRFPKNEYRGRRSAEKQKMVKPVSPKPRVMRTTSISDELIGASLSSDDVDDLMTLSASALSASMRRRSQSHSGKNYKMARAIERDLKHTASDLNLMGALNPQSTPKTEAPAHPVFIQVDTPNRFLSLNSKKSVVSSDTQSGDGSGILSPKRQVSVTPQPECPQDRIFFYKTFSMLIKMGNTAKKEKESRYSRQISSEQEIWQNKVNDLIWLHLQAHQSNRSLEDQDNYLCEARQSVDTILEEIMGFTYQGSLLKSNDGQNGNNPGKEEKEQNNSGCAECRNELTVSPGQLLNATSPYLRTELLENVQQQEEAVVQVTAVLERLEQAEKLYPTLKAMRKAHSLYASEAFTRRVNALCVWLNLTQDIARKLQLLAHVLYLNHINGLEWPWLNYDNSSEKLEQIRNAADMITPEIYNPSDYEDYDEEDDDDEYYEENSENTNPTGGAMTANLDKSMGKNVRFEIDARISSPTSSEDLSNNNINSGPMETSTPMKPIRSISSISAMSGSISNTSLDEQCHLSIYRYFVDRMLKKAGIRKMLSRMKGLLLNTLTRAQEVLEEPSSLQSYTYNVTKESPKEDTPENPGGSTSPFTQPAERRVSLTQMNTVDWQKEMSAVGLPSFQPTYLFLVRIPLDVLHECLRLRLEQMKETEPSLLSIRQLIRECKEVLKGSVLVKQFYSEFQSAVSNSNRDAEDTNLDELEEDMKNMMEVYLRYTQSWMLALQSLPEASKRLKDALEDEWQFTKQVCPLVRGGEAQAGHRFCIMASGLLESISHFLESGIDECIQQLYDSTLGEDSQDDDETSQRNSRCEVRQGIMQCCRHFKNLFHEARERASKAVGFAKTLRKDLEIAAAFDVTVDGTELMEKLKQTEHVRLIAPHSAAYLMFIPKDIADDMTQIVKLLNVTSGREDSRTVVTPNKEGYLLLVKCSGCKEHGSNQCPEWTGESLKVDPTAETTIALSHIAVEGLMMVVHHSSQLTTLRKNLERQLETTVQLLSDQTSCHQAIAESLLDMKNKAMELREQVARAIAQVDDKLNLGNISEMDEVERISIQKLYRETLHQCYNFGFEYQKEVTRLVSGELRVKLATGLVAFAKQWMKFVSEKCERGRGVRPRWANQGLEFLIVVCDSKILATLSEEEFSDLKHSINYCISHVIGEKSLPGSPGIRVTSPDAQRQSVLRYPSWPEGRTTRSLSVRSSTSEPPTPFPTGRSVGDRNSGVEIREGEDGGIMFEVHKEKDQNKEVEPGRIRQKRVLTAVQGLEQQRTNKLYEQRMIGRVIPRNVDVDYHVSIRRVNFKWQRGIKLGEGQFGKVYNAVNMDTGELMAMKEIRFQPNDHQTIKDIADEIKIFEGISHPSLVKYFGVELHRDEMLIFMEYCDEGTLEDIARLGLTEAHVRRYTSEILQAVHVLHEHGIVHRDIKGANIFLRSDGLLKLGDFGCAVKLKNHTTLPGEVNTLVGTTAFMAPEVITRNLQGGSGRASDIWSLGCVVIEMMTGKRPWSELENNMQIMFKVGMGSTPAIPETLSSEGEDFLSHCFEHDPKERWTADQLQNHPFVKVYIEEEPEADVDPEDT